MKPNTKINVSIQFEKTKIPFGELVLNENKIYFKYDADFVNSKLEISPFKLPLNNAISLGPQALFNGLFGVFNDSLPDGWGKLLLDRSLQNKGINPMDITPLDQLAYVAKNGMGSLIYEPEVEENSVQKELLDLDYIHSEMNLILEGGSSEIIEDLFQLGGSCGGARPKIKVGYNPKTNHFIQDCLDLPEDYEHWIIKFPVTFDRKDAAQIDFRENKNWT